ncbi:DUF2142 domain-containing protein [Acidocella sp.]|uniref:DUF2142 domain-containing protein n=1 Tax=Acidocella sp. TaxID=50710 RepID=UPI0026061661|nr:DUF2142 domain-containing protein [Acidocella sp.]MDD2795994.1 DUF2142 domain-containing protein [Acidocella sp.]
MKNNLSKFIILAAFILGAFPVGTMTALLTPLGQSPDEPAHVARAAGLLRGAVLGVRKTLADEKTGAPVQKTGVEVDNGLFRASFGAYTEIENRPVVTEQDFLATRAQLPDHKNFFVNIPNTAAYFPVAYTPATLGMAIGLMLKLSPFSCLMLARFFMLGAFLILGFLALWIAAFGEAVLLVVLLMPMTLFLAGTVNQDAVLIALVCLACAALTRHSRGFRLLGLVVLVLFLGSKPPYILLLGMFLLPLCKEGFWLRVREIVIACVPVLLWVVLISLFVIIPFKKGMYHPGVLYPGDRNIWMNQTSPAINLHILLAKPSRFFTLPWHTILLWHNQFLDQMVGVLGLLQIMLPQSYYMLWGGALVSSLAGLVFCARPEQGKPCKPLADSLWVGFLLLSTYWLIMISFYLSWTNVGLDIIDGMQGRYSLPLLPFLMFLFPSWRGRFQLPPLLPALPAIMLGVYDVGYIPMKLVCNYYLH